MFITNEGCKTVEFVNIVECDTDPSDIECYKENTSVSPNPIYTSGEGGIEEEEIRISWDYSECHNNDDKLPMLIYVYNVYGNNIYTSTAPIYSAAGNFFIPTSVFPGAGSYIVRIQFADGSFVTKLLQVI